MHSSSASVVPCSCSASCCGTHGRSFFFFGGGAARAWPWLSLWRPEEKRSMAWAFSQGSPPVTAVRWRRWLPPSMASSLRTSKGIPWGLKVHRRWSALCAWARCRIWRWWRLKRLPAYMPGHVPHECIELWLRDNSTCLVCRGDVFTCMQQMLVQMAWQRGLVQL